MNYTRNWRLTLIFLKVVVYYNFGDDLSVYIFRSWCERLLASIICIPYTVYGLCPV